MKHLVFDMGNVLLLFDPIGYLKTMLDDQSIDIVYQATVGHPDWGLFDQGLLEVDHLIEQARQRVSPELSQYVERVVVYSYTMLTPIEGMETLLRELKEKGYSLYLLSNVSQKFYDYKDQYTILSYFDGYVISSDIKVNKPDPKIYQTLLRKYHLEASASIFIDDMKHNVEGAVSIGMQGIVFESVNQLKDDLERLLSE